MSSKLSINSRLRKFRIDQGLNQTEMAELFNISASQYSKIESGKCDLNIHHIKALSGNINQPFEPHWEFCKTTKILWKPAL